MYYVYVLKSEKDGSTYIGYTNDLKRRLVEHNGGKNISTKHKSPYELVYHESYKSKSDARYRESNLKQFAQAYKALRGRIKNSLQ